MVTLTIEVDEATDRLLRALAEDYGGNVGKALGDLLAPGDGVDQLADELEASHRDSLRAHLARSKEDHSAGRVVDWETVKSRFNL